MITAGTVCASEEQRTVCRPFVLRGYDRFGEVIRELSATGKPDGATPAMALAWWEASPVPGVVRATLDIALPYA